MLSIKRHFSISKLSFVTGLRAGGDYIAHAWQSFVGGLKALTNRRDHIGRDSLISVLVVLIGFFGTVAALVGLRPATSHNVAQGPSSNQQANGEPGRAVTGTPPANQTPSSAAPSPQVAESPTSQSSQSAVTSQPAMSPVSTASPTTSVTPLTSPQVVQPAATPVAPTPAPVVPPSDPALPPAGASGSGSTNIKTTIIDTVDGVTTPVDSLLP